MKKKIIVIILVVSFLIVGCESGVALHIEKEINEIKDEYIPNVKTYADETDFSFNYAFLAFGAVHKITNITFFEGPASKLSRLNSLFSRKLFFPIFSIVYVSNLTFTISFDELVDVRSEYRYWYGTSYSNGSYNGTNITINTPHSRTVYNFTGIIKFQRPKIFKFFAIEPKFFIPYRFSIIGYCEDIELNGDST